MVEESVNEFGVRAGRASDGIAYLNDTFGHATSQRYFRAGASHRTYTRVKPVLPAGGYSLISRLKGYH
jgi:hypothetical protein